MKKNVLITGVMNETGIAVARAFRKEGFYVYGLDSKEDYESVCDRSFRFDLNEFVSNADYRVRFTRIFDEIIPRLSVLVNNKEIIFEGQLHEVQMEQWQQSININLTGPMMLSKFFLSRLEKSHGAIINIINLSSKIGLKGNLAYTTSRNGLFHLTKAMAMDLKGKVRVNSISFDPHKEKLWLNIGKDEGKKILQEIARISVYIAKEDLKHLSGENIQLG